MSSRRVRSAARSRRLSDLLNVVAHRLAWLQVREQQIAVAQDDGQQVVEVVGHAAGKPPDRLHLLRLTQLVLQSLAVREIEGDRDVSRAFKGGHAHEHGHTASVLAEVFLLPRARDPAGP